MDVKVILRDGIKIAKLEEDARVAIWLFPDFGRKKKEGLISRLKDSAEGLRSLIKKYPLLEEPKEVYNKIAKLTLDELGHEIYDPIFLPI